ncbi:hypothetical protein C0993_007136 [Termitomyces sp. T159_Od127]|nr:hypothetical protein C0993_007136 [Termitomyces sp. T159_Od127]
MDLLQYGQNGVSLPTSSVGLNATTQSAVFSLFRRYRESIELTIIHRTKAFFEIEANVDSSPTTFKVNSNSEYITTPETWTSIYHFVAEKSITIPHHYDSLRNPDDISGFERPTPPFDVSTTYTPAQISRAARQAVNLALRNQISGWQLALHIVNSLHHPILKQDPDAASSPNVTSYPAITFNQPVSPRLASHSLVHGLIRQDQLKHAATLAIAMMDCGMRVRARTLNIVMQSLKAPQRPLHDLFTATQSKTTLPRRFRPDPQNFGDLTRMAGYASTRFALEIFAVARRTGQGNMYGLLSTLLAICLINTEIILASFVFAMLVKEFYHPPPSPQGDTTAKTWNTEKYGPRSLVFLPHWSHFNDLITPMKKYFQHVVTLHTASEQFDQETFEAYLQALAILANLLDLRQLHHPHISPLLTLMYKTPRTSSEVWVQDKEGKVHRVIAFEYFHDVLVRLIESPPSPGIPSKIKPSRKTEKQKHLEKKLKSRVEKRHRRAFTPPLCIETCNTLLHYALRHCHSPTLGNKVLVHLTQVRRLAPDETTYNILLRSGTLLRNDDLASLALTAIVNTKAYKKQSISASEHNLQVVPPLQTLSQSKSEVARHIASVINTINSINLGSVSRQRLKRLHRAIYMLNTLMMHLCSTGHPHLVKPIMFALFPALDRDPSTPLSTHMIKRRKAMRHAARFGPLPFAVLLNALVKARALSEARLLYNFAVAAERRSWFTAKPWALGIEVYTIMLELCVAECRDATRLESIPGAVADHKPDSVRNKAVRMALRLYKRLNKLPYYANNTMRRFGHLGGVHKLKPPKLDERFATALIQVLFVLAKHVDPAVIATPDITVQHRQPRPHIQMKTSAASVSTVYTETRKNAINDRDYLPSGWTQELEFVARGIINAGMDLPPALRHLFLGRYDEAANPANKERGLPLRVVPWAYSGERNKDAWHPWVVPSIRTRGLVMRRMTRDQRARFCRKRNM